MVAVTASASTESISTNILSQVRQSGQAYRVHTISSSNCIHGDDALTALQVLH